MRNYLYLLLLVHGCEDSAHPVSQPMSRPPYTPTVGVQTTFVPSNELTPRVKGIAYQFSLKNGMFGFCDETGSQHITLATGQQSAGNAHCDRKDEVIQSRCDDEVDIVGLPDGPYDTVSAGQYSYRMRGHVRSCDRDGNIVIVSTIGDIDVIDTSANKIAVIDANGRDNVVIGSGWVGWSSLNEQEPLRLEGVTKTLEHAVTPKDKVARKSNR